MTLIPDITVALTAMAGLFVVLWHLARSGARDGLSIRFRSTLLLTAVFLGARSLFWLEHEWVFRALTYISAAVLPLAVFLLAEGMIRRHAPLWAKGFVATGAVVLGFAALWPGLTTTFGFLLMLMLFQLFGFGLAGFLVWSRDRGSLSAAENLRIRRVALSLVFILPFLVSDYRLEVLPIPVRMSGLAILVTCWLSLSLREGEVAAWRCLTTLGWAMGVSVIAALTIGAALDVALDRGVQIWAMSLALILLFEIVRAAARAGEVAQSGRLLAQLTCATERPLHQFLDALRGPASAEGALILGKNELTDFDPHALQAALGQSSVCAMDSLPTNPATDTLPQSQARWLLARYGASALCLVARKPFMLAVVRGGAFAGMAPSNELRAAFAMSRLIAERDASFTKEHTP